MEPDKTAASAPTPTPAPAKGEMPEKYIRTFLSDMDIFKKGGTPGLAPFKTSMPSPTERLVASSPLNFVPIETKVPIPEPTVPPPAPIAPPVVTPIKTYSEDFRERVRNTQASTMTILAAEQDAEPHVQAISEAPARNSHTIWYVAGGLALLIAGSVGVYIAYSHFLTTTAPILIAPSVSTPIVVDSRETVSGTGTVLMQAIKQSVDKPLALNTVRLLSYDSATTSSSIFSALTASVPSMLLRNVDAAGSMAGIVNTNSGQSPFFILSIGSYSTTFSGMLSWEPTMQISLNTLFPLYLAPIPVIPVVATTTIATTTIATTTKTTTKVPAKTLATTTVVVLSPTIGFRDEVVSNHDVRIYRDALGRSIILYGYWNQSTLIIARDPAAFLEILGRLATAHP